MKEIQLTQRTTEGATMMTPEEAGDICREMAEDSGIKDQGLAVNAVIRDLIQLSHNKTSPLVQMDAIEILVALDPEGWAQAWESMPEGLKEEARQFVEAQQKYRAQQQNEGKENA